MIWRYKNQSHINIIKNILQKYISDPKYDTFVFGSRAKWDYQQNSDRDIGIKSSQKIPFWEFANIKNQFAETPVQIDIVDFAIVDEEFYKLASKYKIPLQNL